MSTKTAYVWGPISNFAANLAFSMLENGWTVHLACKSALQISMSPLDLPSSAQSCIEKAAGGAEKLKLYSEKLSYLDADEPQKGTTYDIIVFMGLPSNFDEARVSRSPWAADELATITGKLKGVPVIIVSSLWGGLQEDGVVPEEIEFDRRKPHSHFEGVCQQYESRVLKSISSKDGKWHLVRLPIILGSSVDGRSVNFSGLYKMLQELFLAKAQQVDGKALKSLELSYNPDATFWMLPCDLAANLMVKLLEDNSRPVICNFVSTQSTLNQEWMQDLARALELDSIHSSDKDTLNIPSTLRSMLTDNMQVKTRNLFEVLGRYHHAPMVINSDYFARIINYAQQNNWGQMKAATPEIPFSIEKAREYFEEFLPNNLDQKMAKALGSFKGGLAFQIVDQEAARWILSSRDGKINARIFNPDNDKPKAVFLINSSAFTKLVSGKLMFEQALLTRSLQANGNPIDCLKACDFFRRFLRHFHYSPVLESNTRELEKAVID